MNTSKSTHASSSYGASKKTTQGDEPMQDDLELARNTGIEGQESSSDQDMAQFLICDENASIIGNNKDLNLLSQQERVQISQSQPATDGSYHHYLMRHPDSLLPQDTNRRSVHDRLNHFWTVTVN